MNSIKKVADAGQPIWPDYIDRHLIRTTEVCISRLKPQRNRSGYE